MLEWKMPGFLMTMIKNGIANGRAYAEKRQKMKDEGRPYNESLYDFTQGLKRTVAFQPPKNNIHEIEPVYFDKKVNKSKRKSK